MKSIQTLLPTFVASIATTFAYSPLLLPSLTTHQPNGNPAGQVNYYRIAFTVTSSSNNGTTSSGYCNRSWGDNSWLQPEAYSVNVPTGDWIICDSSEDNLGDKSSDFQFQLFPYFSIGNFSLAVKETLGDGSSLQGLTHITNQTDSYTCEINPREVLYQQHPQGDCSIPEGKGPFEVSVSLM
ncbi:hypothetical protein M409DRAFT_24708 [Zasmidium cellare ATCC 36951]|uniref:AA1-like domain-containing protein n=1 Tax=Zasmidium cellare ATCC 36951 TaxID=1080233 RepID=A0A6A6CDL0_ZASCE|nr:uncharacterized protein M409DRAFT_24708 [Zasmidium cellare ATCC 36951]KAF2164803.1 hypothetical protein M409DRAFT_24708 [Zasmidium cellare ATCC 36951]